MNDDTPTSRGPATERPSKGGGRISRRTVLSALAAMALGGAAASLPGLGRRSSWLPGIGAPGALGGQTPSAEQLRDLVADGLGGGPPVYLPDALPAGWQPAPIATRADVEESRRALFVNPAVRPGLFYRVGYTKGSPQSLDELITVTVRRASAFQHVLGEASPPTPAEAQVVGVYLTVPVPNDDGLDILVQGLAADGEAVREIAGRVGPA